MVVCGCSKILRARLRVISFFETTVAAKESETDRRGRSESAVHGTKRIAMVLFSVLWIVVGFVSPKTAGKKGRLE